jgi:pimeloyl-ACP methyl ester carboxylesterase
MTGKQAQANSISRNRTANTQSRGAALAYRIALWHPELVSHLFTVCVPYARPMAQNISIEHLVRSVTPHFAYQLQFKSGEVEKVIRSKDEVRQFLLALYGGRTEAGEFGFDANKGVLLDKIGQLKPSRLLSEEVSWVYLIWVLGLY